MARPWLARIAQLFKNAKRPARPLGAPRLGIEALEDRVVPAMFTVTNAAGTLSITLGTNEALAVTDSGANTVFTVTGGAGTFTQMGGSAPVSNAAGVLTVADMNLASAVAISNNGALATSTNAVNFNGTGTLTSTKIVLSLTDSDAGVDADNVVFNGLTLTGTGAASVVAVSTQNGAITSPATGTDVSASDNLLLSASAGIGTGAGTGNVAAALNANATLAAQGGSNGVFISNTTSASIGTVTPGPVLGVTVAPLTGVSATGNNISVSVTGANGTLTSGALVANTAPSTNGGNVLLSAAGDLVVNATVSTTSGGISLIGDNDDSGAGNLTIGATGSLTSTSGGAITLGRSVAAGTTGAGAQNVTVNGTVTTSGGPAAAVTDAITLRAEDDVTVNGAVTVLGSARNIVVDGNASGANGVYTQGMGGGLTVAGGRITIVAEDADLSAGAITTGGTTAGAVVLANRTPGDPLVIGADGATAQDFGLTGADFGRITASVVRVGLVTSTGNIRIGETAAAGGAPVTIDPTKVPVLQLLTTGAGTITDGNAGTAGSGTPAGAADLTAQSLLLSANTGIGATGADNGIDLAVTNLAATSGGDVFITGTGNLTLAIVAGDPGLPAGQSTLNGVTSTAGSVGVAANLGNLILNPNTMVSATTPLKTVTLSAGNDLNLSGTITTISGAITLNVDTATDGATFGTDLSDAAGGTLRLAAAATLNSTVTAQVNGGDQSDTFNVRPLTTSTGGAALSVDGKGSTGATGDTLNSDPTGTTSTDAPAAPGAGTITSTGRQNVTYAGIETVNLTAPVVPAVTVVASTAIATEGSMTPGAFTLTRTGDAAIPLTATVAITGTATGADFTLMPATTTTVTFAAGSATAVVNVSALADTEVDPGETVVLTVSAPPGSTYTVGAAGSATVTIDDINVVPTITVAATTATTAEGSTTPGAFTLTRTGDPTSPLTVLVAISGTATATGAAADFTLTPATTTMVTFAAGSATATVAVAAVTDTFAESNETVVLTLAPGTGYTVGATPSATVTITQAAPPPSSSGPPPLPPAPTPDGQPTSFASVSEGNVVLTKTNGATQTVALDPIFGVPVTTFILPDFTGNGGTEVGVLTNTGPIVILDGTTGAIIGLIFLDLNGDGVADSILQVQGGRFLFIDGKTGRAVQF